MKNRSTCKKSLVLNIISQLRCYCSEEGLCSDTSNSSFKIAPEVIYDNAHEYKKIAIKSNRGKSGVYR